MPSSRGSSQAKDQTHISLLRQVDSLPLSSPGLPPQIARKKKKTKTGCLFGHQAPLTPVLNWNFHSGKGATDGLVFPRAREGVRRRRWLPAEE